MRDTPKNNERYVKNNYFNEEKSERYLFEKDLSLFMLLIIYGLSQKEWDRETKIIFFFLSAITGQPSSYQKWKTLPWRIFLDYGFIFVQIRIFASLQDPQLVRMDWNLKTWTTLMIQVLMTWMVEMKHLILLYNGYFL